MGKYRFSPYLQCLHPSLQMVNGVPVYCACGKCEACVTQKNDVNASLLRAETAAHKYCVMLTATYNDDSIPRFEPVVDTDACGFSYLVFYPTSERVSLLYESRFNAHRTQKSVEEKGKLPLPFLDLSLEKSTLLVDEYLERRQEYSKRYPSRAQYTNEVDLLCSKDIQNFIKRLRKYIDKHYGEKIRIYIVGEYGTESLRPHWHVLVFFDSDKLYEAFVDEVVVSRKTLTSGNVREIKCARFLCESAYPLWPFGNISSEITDGNAYGYVAGYVTGNSTIPSLLTKLARPRTYHSSFLGTNILQNYVEEVLRSEDWKRLDQVLYRDAQGFESSISVPRSLLFRYFPLFGKCIAPIDETLYRQLSVYSRFDEETKQKTCAEIGRQLVEYYRLRDCEKKNPFLNDLCGILDYVIRTSSVANDFNPVCRVLRASKRFCYYASKYHCTPRMYFEKMMRYKKYRDLSCLKYVYSKCETDELYKKSYYNLFIEKPIDHANRVVYNKSDGCFYQKHLLQDLVDYNFLSITDRLLSDFQTKTINKYRHRIKHYAQAVLYNDL